MNIASLLKRTATLTLLIALLAGCQSPQGKPTYSATGADGSLPDSDLLTSQDINGNGALPNRPDGFNPETDVDYQTLSAYTIYFDYDNTTIKPSERGKLTKIEEWLAANPGKQLFLAGHADKRGTLEYNRGLGERRAQSVRSYLIGLDISASTLQTISYGMERPAAEGDTEAAFAQNRRVQVGVIKSK